MYIVDAFTPTFVAVTTGKEPPCTGQNIRPSGVPATYTAEVTVPELAMIEIAISPVSDGCVPKMYQFCPPEERVCEVK